MARTYTLSHINFAKIHCFKRTLKGIVPHVTLSHNFLINCNTLSHNFYQKRTPCRIIITVKGHPVERHIPSSQVWEYPPPGITSARNFEFRAFEGIIGTRLLKTFNFVASLLPRVVGKQYSMNFTPITVEPR